MNWEAIGAIGEVLGAAVVFISLMYVALQLRENTKNLKVQSLNETFRERNDITGELQSNGGTFRKVLSNEELTEAEKFEAGMLFLRICMINDKLLYLHSMGAADDFNFKSFSKQLPRMTTNEFFDEWWSQSKAQFSQEFQTHIDAMRGDA